jgi:DNA-binding transcriptional ArsR family regulator
LKVLEEAGLIERSVEGREHLFRLRRKPLREAEGWLVRQQAFWDGAVDQLDRLLAGKANDGP